MDDSPSLRRLRETLGPPPDVEARIRARVQRRIVGPSLLTEARKALTPASHTQERVWQRIGRAIALPATTLFDRLRTWLNPEASVQAILKQRIFLKLQPITSPPLVRASFKWVAAFALVALFVRVSPLLFIAPRSVAESPIILLPTQGDVSMLIGGLWQPLKNEVTLTSSVLLQTAEGEATILLHDDGVVRLGPHTTVALHDVSDRPALPEHDPTLTLHTGSIWVQGLLPVTLQGLSVGTPQGKVIVHEGSVAIDQTDAVSVRVFDRHAEVERTESDLALVAGERVELSHDAAVLVKKITAQQYEEGWVTQNLKRDAVHRREIAQLQQERRAASAGILPTSRLYPVKRAAEAVDVLLTFGEEAKAQKRLEQAETRFNEAAALLAEGSPDVTASLDEYRETLLAVSTGSGQGSLVDYLVQQKLTEATADVSASLPDDESYPLKKAVLETSAALSGSALSLEGVLVFDSLAAFSRAVEEGDFASANATFQQLSPRLSSLDQDPGLTPAMRKEVRASLTTIATAIGAHEGEEAALDFLKDAVAEYVTPAAVSQSVTLTEEQIAQIVAGIEHRIFLYKQPRSRWNQLQHELRQLRGHDYQGPILRRLFHALPENGLAKYVRTEIQKVRGEKEGEL